MKSTESTPWRSPLRTSRRLETNGHEPERTKAEIDARLKPGKQSVVPKKKMKADVRRFETVLVEIGLVLALGLIIGALKAPIHWEKDFVIPEAESVVVKMEEVEQTQQIKRPPPPPRPPVPVEVPNESVLEDEPLDIDSEIDISQPLDLPPLPPPPAKEEGDESETEIFVVVEEMPELIGGIQSLYDVIKYPELALRAGIEGTVVVGFVIETNGEPTNLTVMKSGGSILDTAALDAIKQLRFKPGKQRGKAVRVRYAMPVRFKLTEAKGHS